MSNFYKDIIQTSQLFHTTRCVNTLSLLEPNFRAKIEYMVKACPTLYVTETYRSQERQQFLFTQGATELQRVGVHHFGLACDFAKLIGGELSWKGDWSFLGKLAQSAGLIWGGDWGDPAKVHHFQDMDHVQGVSIVQQAGLFAGVWYPGEADGL